MDSLVSAVEANSRVAGGSAVDGMGSMARQACKEATAFTSDCLMICVCVCVCVNDECNVGIKS